MSYIDFKPKLPKGHLSLMPFKSPRVDLEQDPRTVLGEFKFNSPAKIAGLIDHIWSLQELLTFRITNSNLYPRPTASDISIKNDEIREVNCRMTKLPEVIFKQWIHSYEEDYGNIKVYRPLGYKLPPSRGRKYFEIDKSGIFVLYDIGSADRSSKAIGSWHLIGANKLRIDFNDSKRKSCTLNILSMEDDRLLLSSDRMYTS